jgi:hypothetical protein
LELSVASGFKIEDVSLKMIERPERCLLTREGWFVDRDRFLSFLEAMTIGHALPPLRVEVTESGSLKVANGFHRYYCSIALGYTEIPVLWQWREHTINAEHWKDGKRCNRTVNGASDCKAILLLNHTTEDGSDALVEALVLAPKTRSMTTLGARRKSQQSAPCRLRYEPPAVRKERLRREEEERKQQQLAEKATNFAKNMFSKDLADSARRERMTQPPVTYAEKSCGRIRGPTPPSWDGEPELQGNQLAGCAKERRQRTSPTARTDSLVLHLLLDHAEQCPF